MVDVLICGAGPAGSLAATILARAGAKVLLLDRARFPREKLCGDTVNPGAVRILERHRLGGVLEGALDIEGMIVTSPRGVRVHAPYGAGVRGRAISRRDLDVRLARAAADAGAQLEEQVTVDGAVMTEQDAVARVSGARAHTRGDRATTMEARVVIAADGAQSRVAAMLQLSRPPAHPRRWAIGAYFENVTGLSRCGEMHVRPDRYIGVAPLSGGIANACVVTADPTLLKHGRALLAATLREDPQLADRFAGARMVASPVSVGPLAVECATAGMPGLLLAGDAAGFIDPMTGDGLRFALRGAELAAAEALRALEHGFGTAHLRLTAARREAFARKWRFNRSLRSLVSSAAAVRAAGRGAAIAPALVRTMIRYAADLRAA